MTALTQQRLQEILDYNPKSGVFRWRINLGKKRHVGKIAGTRHPHGYIRIRIARQNYYAHRRAWLHLYGRMPKIIDHRDGNPANNAICNLREANQSQNGANTKRRKDNTTGFKGVVKHTDGRRFRATLEVGDKRFFSGLCATASEAHVEYTRMALAHFGEFARSK